MPGAPPETPPSRRPLASRSTWWARAAAAALARRGVSPNAISAAGLLFGCAAGLVLAATARTPEWQRGLFLAAAALVQLRLLCNLLDGMVAVEGGRRSATGALWNEAPDRVSDAATLVGAGYAASAAPLWGWAAACVAIWVAYVRALGASAGAPDDFCGPMAKPHRMALVTAAALFLAAAPEGWRASFPWMDAALATIVVLGLATSARRLVRAARHLRGASR